MNRPRIHPNTKEVASTLVGNGCQLVTTRPVLGAHHTETKVASEK